MAKTLGLYPYLPIIALYNLLDYEESKAYALTIDLSSPMELAKLLEQMLDFFRLDSYSCIFYCHL